ncbi:MAG TPA: uracil-DNA glycosylase [Rhodoblastus sp.]|nr:uracil-DNA glycosylase [Rhodoblastus sp.]
MFSDQFSGQACPPRDCPRCARLVAYRQEARARAPDWFNAPVPPFGAPDARLLIVGLAPGLQGANRTGRPFTGDYAGDLLYSTLGEFGLAAGTYAARPDDGLTLVDAAIVNAVRCVPPQNKPLPAEIAQCRPFLSSAVAEMPQLRVLVALGRVAHESVVRTFAAKLSAHTFAHGAEFELQGPHGPVALLDSYHCSRYNTNTRVLTPDMFRAVFARARAILDDSPPKRG